jgi:hypothetical protein
MQRDVNLLFLENPIINVNIDRHLHIEQGGILAIPAKGDSFYGLPVLDENGGRSFRIQLSQLTPKSTVSRLIPAVIPMGVWDDDFHFLAAFANKTVSS